MNRKYFLDEKWMPVIGYEGLYAISNYGRLKNLNYRGSGQVYIMNLHALKGHPIIVGLVKGGCKKQFRVHRLVAYSFLGIPESSRCFVLHKNGNIQDNRVENLMWTNVIEGRTLSDYTRLCISYALRHPSKVRRERMSEGQRRRFQKERETHTGRYAKR